MAKIDEILVTHADKLKDKDYKSVYSDINTKMEELGFEVLINDKKAAEFVPAGRLHDVVAQRDQFKTQVGDLNKQLESLKAQPDMTTKMQADIQALIDNNNGLMKQIEQTKIDTNIQLAAKDAVDPKDILMFVNRDKIKMNVKGEISGIEEELTRLRTEKPHLFGKVDPKKAGMDNSGKGGQNTANMNSMIRKAAGRGF